MLGLKRGTVKLVPYQPQWKSSAEDTIALLNSILGKTAQDIQHVGSTAVAPIQAKPIIDIAVGVCDLEEILPYTARLRQHGMIFRGQDVNEQLLFVMGDFEKDTRTHHIHIVKWKSAAWNHYINFRDYLNAFPKKAQIYDNWKQKLASTYPNDRENYTKGKQELIQALIKEANDWKAGRIVE